MRRKIEKLKKKSRTRRRKKWKVFLCFKIGPVLSPSLASNSSSSRLGNVKRVGVKVF